MKNKSFYQHEEWMDEISRDWIEWTWHWEQIRPLSPLGEQYKRQLRPFIQGDEKRWQEEIDLSQRLAQEESVQQTAWKHEWEEALTLLPDPTSFITLLDKKPGAYGSIEDWYELKQFLWQAVRLFACLAVFDETYRSDQKEAQQLLKHLGEHGRSFSLRDIAPSVRRLYQQHWELRLQQQRRLEQLKKQIETRVGYPVVEGQWLYLPKQDTTAVQCCRDDRSLRDFLMETRQTPFEVVFELKHADLDHCSMQLKDIERKVAQAEEEKLKQLREQFRPFLPRLKTWIRQLSAWDWRWAKAKWAERHGWCWPALHSTTFSVQEGFFPYLRDKMKEKKRNYRTLSLRLEYGLTTIVGTNMGGKSVALKTIALIAALAHHALPVPATKAVMPLMTQLRVIHGDFEQLDAGVSTFGAEMRRLSSSLSGEHKLLLLDELARGTNPMEGEALAYGVGKTLEEQKRHIAVLITHFPILSALTESRKYRVQGLDDQGHIDYTLVEQEDDHVPQQGIRIAQQLGISNEVLEHAKQRLNDSRERR